MAEIWPRDGAMDSSQLQMAVDSLNAEPLALKSSSYSYLSEITDAYLEESGTSADEHVLTSFSYPIEDEVSADELVITMCPKPTVSKKVV
jgi:hypothetical protein